MLHNFYGNYRVDDSNIGCHRVLYADCDGIHKYKSVCELVKECMEEKQLKNQCIVDFFNSNLSRSAGQYLKITSNGCLMPGTPECPCDDRYVAATDNDTKPGPLIKKLVGGCDPTGTYCISVGSPNPNTVQVLPSGPINGFTQFKGTADCDDAIVKMNKKGEVFTVCPDVPGNIRYCYAIHTGGSVTIPWNTTKAIPAANGIVSDREYSFSGKWDIFATEGFKRDTEDGVFLIEESGIYMFSSQVYVRWNPEYVNAIRGGLWINGTEIGDIKYDTMHGSWDEASVKPQEAAPTFSTDPDKDWMIPLRNSGLSFSSTFVFPVQASRENPARIKWQLKPDTRSHLHNTFPKGDITFEMTDHTSEAGPKAFISCFKMNDSSQLYSVKSI